MALGSGSPGSEVRDDGRVRWAIGGSPIDYFNCVAYVDLTRGSGGPEIDSHPSNECGPTVSPAPGTSGPRCVRHDLGARLLAHGFEYGGDDIGMAVELSALPEEIYGPADFVVERVHDEAGLAEWATTFGLGLRHRTGTRSGGSGEMLRRLGFGDEEAWRHYLGRLAGEPVTTSALFFAAGVAGSIAFHRRARQKAEPRGCRDARSPARSKGSRLQRRRLGSSEMGYGVYRRLGFENTAGSVSTSGIRSRPPAGSYFSSKAW